MNALKPLLQHLLYVLLVLSFSGTAAAAEPVVRYRNAEYGFSVGIPSRLPVERAEAPRPDHGVTLRLPSGGTIWIDGSYDAAFLGSAMAAAKQALAERSVAAAPKPRALRAAGLAGASFVLRKDNRLLKQYVVYRSRPRSVSIIYTVGLETSTIDAMADTALVDGIFRTLAVLPLPR